MSVCAECGKQLEGQRRAVCSQACYRKRVVRMNREARQRRTPVPEMRTCPVCAKPFQPGQFNPAAARQVTCSPRCGYEKHKARMRDGYAAMSPDDKARFLSEVPGNPGKVGGAAPLAGGELGGSNEGTSWWRVR